jgi:hypothetical protein
MRRVALLAIAPLVLGMSACDSDKPTDTTPPAAGAKLCDVTEAGWWFDATGAGGLTGAVDGVKLPLTNPTQNPISTDRAECKVFADGKEVGRFVAELTSADEVIGNAKNIAKRSAEEQFDALGNKGAVTSTAEGKGEAWWTCGSTLLQVHLIHGKDDGQLLNLTKTLAQHVAGVVGCPGPEPKAG